MSNELLWQQYKTTRDENVKRRIMGAYINLVHYVVHNSRFTSNIMDSRDYFQFGIEGLNEAIDRFDPDYGTKFETYAILRIRGKIIDQLRKINPMVTSGDNELLPLSNISLSKTFDDDQNSLSLNETIPDDISLPDEVLDKTETKEILVKALEKLNERDRLVITLYYFEELNFKEIAETLDLSIGRVSQIHTKVLSNLKKLLGGSLGNKPRASKKN
jgi:RNA polymerase sigma factor for flagellar operon FliA